MDKGLDPVAVYGAALSTALAFWSLWRSKQRITVEAMPSYGIHPDGEDGNGYIIIVRNLSSAPVQVVDLGMAFPGCRITFLERLEYAWRYRKLRHVGWSYTGNTKGLPVTIPAGHSHRVILGGELESGIRDAAKNSPAFPWVSDGLYRRIHGRRLAPPF